MVMKLILLGIFSTCQTLSLPGSPMLISINNNSYSCFEKDNIPVDSMEIFEGHCLDANGNKFRTDEYLTSCCHCLMYVTSEMQTNAMFHKYLIIYLLQIHLHSPEISCQGSVFLEHLCFLRVLSSLWWNSLQGWRGHWYCSEGRWVSNGGDLRLQKTTRF